MKLENPGGIRWTTFLRECEELRGISLAQTKLLQRATKHNVNVSSFLEKLRLVLDFSALDLVKAELFDEALTQLDEKVSGQVLKYTTSYAMKVQTYFDAMTDLHKELMEMDVELPLETQSKKRKIDAHNSFSSLSHSEIHTSIPFPNVTFELPGRPDVIATEIIPMEEVFAAPTAELPSAT